MLLEESLYFEGYSGRNIWKFMIIFKILMCFTFAEGGNDYDYFDSQLCEDYDFHEGLYSCYYLLRIF